MTASLAAAAAIKIAGACAAAVATIAIGQSAAAQEKPAVLGVWVPASRGVPDPLPLTDAARAALRAAEPAAPEPAAPELPASEAAAPELAALEPAAHGAATACAPGMPALLDTHDAVEITQQGDRIRMSYAEWSGAMRTVYMDPRNGPPTQEPSPLGVSFGRWEARTLAIFTTYIAYPYFDRAGTPQSAAVTVLERYTPSADGARLESKVTVTDAATFVSPVVIAGTLAAYVPAASTPESTPAPAAAPLVAGGCVG